MNNSIAFLSKKKIENDNNSANLLLRVLIFSWKCFTTALLPEQPASRRELLRVPRASSPRPSREDTDHPGPGELCLADLDMRGMRRVRKTLLAAAPADPTAPGQRLITPIINAIIVINQDSPENLGVYLTIYQSSPSPPEPLALWRGELHERRAPSVPQPRRALGREAPFLPAARRPASRLRCSETHRPWLVKTRN